MAAATLGAKAPIGGGAVGSPVIGREETQKKNIDPRLIGAGAFLLVAAVVGFFVMNSTGSGSDDPGIPGIDPQATQVPVGRPDVGTTSVGSVQPAPPVQSPGNPAPAEVVMPFTMVTPPNPQFATGTVGILVAQDKMGQAAGLARFAKNQLSHNGKWQNMQVAVFTDRQTADTFSQYQSRRRGAPLTSTEYGELASKGVWTTTPVFLDSRGKSDRVFYPSKTPYGWWSGH